MSFIFSYAADTRPIIVTEESPSGRLNNFSLYDVFFSTSQARVPQCGVERRRRFGANFMSALEEKRKPRYRRRCSRSLLITEARVVEGSQTRGGLDRAERVSSRFRRYSANLSVIETLKESPTNR